VTLFPYTTLFRSIRVLGKVSQVDQAAAVATNGLVLKGV
jgi:hypothetical protein